MKDLSKKLSKLPMLKDSDHRKSVSFTMLFLTFNLSLVWYGFFIFSGLLPFVVPVFSSSDAVAMLTPMIALYFGRRWQQDKKDKEASSSSIGEE